jgi:hypothetical protein
MSWEAWGDGDDGSGDYADRLIDAGWLTSEQAEDLIGPAREWIRWRREIPYRSHNGTEVRDAAAKLEAAFIEVFGLDFMIKEPKQ